MPGIRAVRGPTQPEPRLSQTRTWPSVLETRCRPSGEMCGRSIGKKSPPTAPGIGSGGRTARPVVVENASSWTGCGPLPVVVNRVRTAVRPPSTKPAGFIQTGPQVPRASGRPGGMVAPVAVSIRNVPSAL